MMMEFSIRIDVDAMRQNENASGDPITTLQLKSCIEEALDNFGFENYYTVRVPIQPNEVPDDEA
jgi:hypothetical protein